ncbi:D-alanyl-D-alanine carboxypeptidase/D-alanyl-D-alanine-endopeptidase [Xylophilus rhododendri]|uniref:D-alanyl-D-alanine carboxypeptidase/D-alanyl-D-alanine-endopeptidase n=1 Tax=Xylophilus rhododendri TaxID=2697032 RepID=A0A857J6P3_9BURK|nr:D-alanyl-D-alanine carboxypeptidase/D-alanyl-D-alanine-endopeptidase [Xylophilus rhododendri]QHI98913.1 D-alanyl-D-alanine carboxypeptidase/D-alanyl-D-alanine-endopeptidase [Xylophilus rhododendri]
MPSFSSSRRAAAALLLSLALPGLPLTAAAQSAERLPPEVEAALQRARLPADALSVIVAPADGGAARLRWRAERPVNPASVMKLVTTYAALDILGPAFRWNTPVTLGGPVDTDGTLQGDVFIKGQGDPSMVMERLWLLLRRLQAQGVKNIAGDIVLDRSAFVLPPHDAAAFDGEPSKPYNAAPDALLINFRALTLGFVPEPAIGRARVMVDPPLAGLKLPDTVPLAPARTACGDWRGALQADLSSPDRIAFAGSYAAECGEKSWPVAYADPDHYAERAISGMWRAMGGRLAGRVREGRAPAGFAPAFSAASPTLAEVIRDINKYSNNVMAQQVFLTLSLQAGGSGSFEASRALVQGWWRARFPDVEPPVLDNGAGLSREGRISAQALARLLQAAWRSPLMPDLAASLPMAGIDGTLRRSQAAAGSAHLKTGSLNDVAAVAGYVHTASGRRWVLVAVANDPNAAAARPAFDALVNWAARQP